MTSMYECRSYTDISRKELSLSGSAHFEFWYFILGTTSEGLDSLKKAEMKTLVGHYFWDQGSDVHF